MPAGFAASHVETGLAIPSTLLAHPIPYTIYMPDGAPPPGGWPVLYLLHGLDGNEQDWLNAGKIAATLDALTGDKKCRR